MKKKRINRRGFLKVTGAVAAAAMVSPRALASELKGTRRIVRAAIHPAIGVARIGDSRDPNKGCFIGPEVIEPIRTDAGQSRDASGALKRQAARFRIYGYDDQGNVVRELTADEAEIKWRVHLANRKAQWFRFLAPLDLPESKDLVIPRRNASVQGGARAALAIDPGAREASGRSIKGVKFDGGSFEGAPVSLGELRTDIKGRLLVLGGLGQSGSPRGTPVYFDDNEETFNNADGWYDDISDGPVRASVSIGGQEIPVEPAWVIVAPPNYAPDVIGWRTLYDLIKDVHVQSGLLPVPEKTYFTKDILPIFKRLTGLQWVNKGFAIAFGKGTVSDFENPEIIAKLADPSQDGLHRRLHDFFRHSQQKDPSDKRLWPMIYGDAYGTFKGSRQENFQVTGLIELHLKRWADGEYVNDWDPNFKPPRRFADVPLAEQPAMLDQAALHFCLADAFHPGCELTWPMRHASLYSAPFRIKQRSEGAPEPDYGDQLTAANAFGPGGPLNEQGPGGLTRWMALPWQGDTVFCRSGYDPDFDPYLPTFWAARVPNQVLTETDYAIVMDTSLPRETRLKAFKKRSFWTRAFKGAASQQILRMVSDFAKMGILEARPGIQGDPEIPAVLLVESLPPPEMTESVPLGSAVPQTESVPVPERGSPKSPRPPRPPGPKTKREQQLEDAGWESEEQLAEFKRLFKGKKRGS